MSDKLDNKTGSHVDVRVPERFIEREGFDGRVENEPISARKLFAIILSMIRQMKPRLKKRMVAAILLILIMIISILLFMPILMFLRALYAVKNRIRHRVLPLAGLLLMIIGFAFQYASISRQTGDW